MRGILLILILVVVLAIGAFATGLLNLTPVREGRVPSVAAKDGKLKVKGGQAPKLEVEAGKIAVGSGQATISVPRLEVRQPGNQQAPANQQGAAPAPGVTDTDATQQ